jgi:hypothetical protein
LALIDELTPILNEELARFGRDLQRAGHRRTRRCSRPLIIAFATLAIAVPAAVGGVVGLLPGDGDHAQLTPPPGYVAPRAIGTGVEVASGEVSTGRWIAYAVACGGRAGVVIRLPDGSGNGAGCGAVRPGSHPAAPNFAPATLYDGTAQTTFIYAATAPSVARVRLDLVGRAQDGPLRLPGAGPSHVELTPQRITAADQALRMTIGFVVVAVPGEQNVKAAEALAADGRVITRCEPTGACEDVTGGG